MNVNLSFFRYTKWTIFEPHEFFPEKDTSDDDEQFFAHKSRTTNPKIRFEALKMFEKALVEQKFHVFSQHLSTQL